MTQLLLPKKCVSYKSGHNPHWIQISLASKDEERPPIHGQVVEIRSDGTFDCEVGTRKFHLWNHDVERLADATKVVGGEILYQAAWSLILVPSSLGKHAFCVAETNNRCAHCTTEVSGESLAEVLRSAGGITVEAADDRWGAWR